MRFHKASAHGSAPAGLHESKSGLGAGNFVFKALQDSTAAATGQDTIYDFSRGQGDKIDLRGVDANASTKADNAFTFIGTDKFHKQAGELR